MYEDVIRIAVQKPRELARWMEEKLEFKVSGSSSCLKQGNLTLILEKKSDNETEEVFGFQHIALKAKQIESALEYCREKGLQLDTDRGRPYYNPSVWKDGTLFFNLINEFGLNLEICQSAGTDLGTETQPVWGLDHVGIMVRNIEKSEVYFERKGFQTVYPRVKIEKSGGKWVLCTMMRRGGIILEVYEVNDLTDLIFLPSGIKELEAEGCVLKKGEKYEI